MSFFYLFHWVPAPSWNSCKRVFFFSFADKLPAGLRPLADKITKLLLKFPGSRVARFVFSDIYFREYGEVLKPKDWGFGNVDELVRALGEILEVRMNFTNLACSLFSIQTVHFSSPTHLRV